MQHRPIIPPRELAIEERRVALGERKARLQLETKVAYIDGLKLEMELLDSIGLSDDCTKLSVKDRIMNYESKDSKDSIVSVLSTVSEIAIDTMKIKAHVFAKKDVQAGKAVAAKFREMYSAEPKKRKQNVGGRVCSVNAYAEEDIPWIRETIREAFKDVSNV